MWWPSVSVMSQKRTRRQFIGAAGTATVLALAGCSDGGGGGTTTDTEAMDDETMGDGDMTPGDMTPGETTEEGMEEGNMEEGGMSGPTTFTVRIENVAPTDFYGSDSSTGGQIWITPGAWAVHEGQNPIYTEGEAASIGLEALAEAGPPTGFEGEPGLVEELQGMMGNMSVASAGAYTPDNTVADPNDPMGEVPGAPPIAPGGAFEFDVEAEMGQRLSFASMFVPSNDLFFAPGTEGIPLWNDDGEPMSGDVTGMVGLWDAGTEPNGQPGYGPDQAPAQDSPTQGGDEGGVVRPLAEVNDGYDYPDVSNAISVTLTPQ
jgi:hypothetical protein